MIPPTVARPHTVGERRPVRMRRRISQKSVEAQQYIALKFLELREDSSEIRITIHYEGIRGCGNRDSRLRLQLYVGTIGCCNDHVDGSVDDSFRYSYDSAGSRAENK